MEYQGYELTEKKNGIIVENVRDFDLVHIFECGQSFRWRKQADGSFMGVAGGKAVRAAYREGSLSLYPASVDDFIDHWYEYFDLGRDYAKVKEVLAGKDEILRAAVSFGHGIRLLRQELWETLISFIISSNNTIPRIMKIVEAIAGAYGEEITLEGSRYFAFPGADRLSGASVEEMEVCRGGYRCKYIVNTAKMIHHREVDLNHLGNMDTDRARAELMKLPGVGAKVADCVLLFSGIKREVFPTDVWVKRVMEALYFKREASFEEIRDFAKEHFGDLMGFAQQYLFYYARENRIGVK